MLPTVDPRDQVWMSTEVNNERLSVAVLHQSTELQFSIWSS